MTSFTSLIELVAECSVGDRVAWIGEHALEHAGETTRPNTITNIERGSEFVRVDGEGIRGGEYFIKAYEDGASEAFFNSPNKDTPQYMGRVVMACITDSDEPVPIQRGYRDLRSQPDGPPEY